MFSWWKRNTKLRIIVSVNQKLNIKSEVFIVEIYFFISLQGKNCTHCLSCDRNISHVTITWPCVSVVIWLCTLWYANKQLIMTICVFFSRYISYISPKWRSGRTEWSCGLGSRQRANPWVARFFLANIFLFDETIEMRFCVEIAFDTMLFFNVLFNI